MYYAIKQYTKKNYPNFFIKARNIKDQLKTELKTLRQVGLIRILKKFFPSKTKWQVELPIQTALKFPIAANSLETLFNKYEFKEGGHTIYALLSSITELANLEGLFSSNAGIKIVKRKGNINEPFASQDKTCRTHKLFSPSHSDLIIVYNLFYSLEMGPRLYDLVELQFENGDVHMAYIMEHIQGKEPQAHKCESFITNLKELEARKLLKLVNWNGYKDIDFICPDCNGNLIEEERTGKLKYVDLQNFALGNYYTHLRATALKAAAYSHFGDKSYLMGGEYLYQEVPGLNMIAKRSPAERFKIWKTLLNRCGLTVENRMIIDIGCNLGLMSAQYLKNKAAWVHGFDMPNVITHTENVLLSLGCTRFSLTGIELSESTNILNQLPVNFKNSSQPAIISYLAIRGHIGWIKELGKIPWDFMLYEGHQEENEEMSLNFIAELQKIKKCFILEKGWISDANSSPRYIAVIKADLEI